ncbi:MAG TPA: formate--tetrahydrofolate ligase [Isosphaeraceae bacterium]|nr:formate--tetrahydrofolate ligase [Isosphaeraceae bacterium]
MTRTDGAAQRLIVKVVCDLDIAEEFLDPYGRDKAKIRFEAMAKTQDSLSDNPKLRGRPRGFTVHVRDIEIAAGAGFLVALTGEIMRMPGLPERPAAEHIDVDAEGTITGL